MGFLIVSRMMLKYWPFRKLYDNIKKDNDWRIRVDLSTEIQNGLNMEWFAMQGHKTLLLGALIYGLPSSKSELFRAVLVPKYFLCK